MQKKVFVLSLGCPKNLVDSEVMLGLLGKAGYLACDAPEEADLLLVNTCGFIQPAVEEGVDRILELARVKQEKPGTRLAVCGCMVQRYGEELRRELPEVDLFVGTEGFQHIDVLLADLDAGRDSSVRLEQPVFLMNAAVPRQVSTPRYRAYLKITEGCANRCSYCLIPSLRGGLRSRALGDLIAEAQALETAGVKELTLIGQDLTAYGQDLGRNGPTLPDLLAALAKETAIPWLRMLYLFPTRVDDALLGLVAENPRILPYFDIPLQHVSDRILKAMHRPYGNRQAAKLVERIRQQLPQAAIRTTFMVGFPGETEEDAAELAAFLQRYRLDHVGIFTYSNEEGSAAAKLPGHCAEKVKEQRSQRLMELQAAISLEKNQQLVGRQMQVLVEGISQETDLLLEGRTWRQAPEIDGRVYITAGQTNAGAFANVQITEAHTYDLVGEIVTP